MSSLRQLAQPRLCPKHQLLPSLSRRQCVACAGRKEYSAPLEGLPAAATGVLAAALVLGSALPAVAAAPEVPIISGLTAVLTEAQLSTAERPQAFLELAVDGEPQGRIAVQTFDDVPVGSQRFLDLAQGAGGVSFRRSKFDALTAAWVRNSGVRSLSYTADGASAIAGGDSIDLLEVELERPHHSHSEAGLVSFVVRDSEPRQTKDKLVAYQGKLVVVQEYSGGEAPNGSSFVITLQPCPELDATNLVIGRVVQGMDMVEQLSKLPTVKSNKSSPYFQVAKAVGDKRATVAEKGFGRPFNKIVVSNSGLL